MVTIMPSQEDYAYLAGLVDGDGYIGFTCSSNKTRSVGTCRLHITNTDSALIEKLHKKFGGVINICKRGRNDLKRKDVYKLYFGNRSNLLKILKNIHPYLIRKKKQAELVILFQIGKPTEKTYRISNEEHNRRLKIVNLLKKLNKKGG